MHLVFYPPNSQIAFYIFNYPIRYYGLIMAICFLIGIMLTSFLIKKRLTKTDVELFFDYSPVVIFISIIGARLFYIVGDFNYYLSNPNEIIMINHGGLSIFGAILAGFLTLIFLSKIKSCK